MSKKKEIQERDPLNIFTPGIYHGLQDEPFTTRVTSMEVKKVIQIVQMRAHEDGQWCIDMDLVGDNQDKMLRMIDFVSDPTHIVDALEHYIRESRNDLTIDYLCRDLANSSKWAGL